MATAMNLPFLLPIPRGCVYIALGAWLLTGLGLVLHPVRWRERTAPDHDVH
jgi:hypothetical protein